MNGSTIQSFICQLDRELGIKLVVIGLIAYYIFTQFPYFYPFPEWTGWWTATILTAIGITASSYKNLVITEGLPVLEVSGECSGVVLMMIFPLVIFLIPNIPLSHRIGSLLFIPILYFGNIIRIVIDTLVGLRFGADALTFFHDTLGQVFIFFWTILLYILWLRLFDHFPREKKVMHPDGYD